MGRESVLVKDRSRNAPEESRLLRAVRNILSKSDAKRSDHLIHERMRLGILSALAVNASLSFNDLKKLLNTTDGNLSVHARKLEEAGYIRCSKYFVKRVPKTEFRLSAVGRRALERYLDEMEKLIAAMRRQ